MAHRKDKPGLASRRAFLKSACFAPALFLPAPFQGFAASAATLGNLSPAAAPLAGESRYNPHYPSPSPLDELFRQILPGSDQYVLEKCAFDISQLLCGWAAGLLSSPPALEILAAFLDPAIEASSLLSSQEASRRSANGVETFRRRYSAGLPDGRDRFLQGMKSSLAAFTRLDSAEFQIVSIQSPENPETWCETEIRYEFTGGLPGQGREQRIGSWQVQWSRAQGAAWRAQKWEARGESVSRCRTPLFTDVTSRAAGGVDSYHQQLLHGVDYWRTVLDGATGIDVYGNNGVAVGDFNNDGFDDLYICQPAGLPNRLYRNRGDGTFEDVTEKAGVDVLDATASAIFADFGNKGVQDLLVLCGSGPLLFLNQGNGQFALQRGAFKFAQPPQGTFTHASVADYDHDGRLDIYLCLYSYYLGLDQYHYPAPYFDARNGPPNFLLHNEGNGLFEDRTARAGLNADNDRYSFASAWGDANGDGWPDLYVVNDFGRNNLYRNNGDGTFQVASAEAGVEDVGAGMSAAWCDFDNHGRQDLYAANMWASAGIRVSGDPQFHPKDPEAIRALYRQHARGNSLYRNLGDGKFRNVSAEAGADIGRWAWCSDAWDFDHDGYSDLYIANGYISGPDTRGLSSFFWRHVVANSPPRPTASPGYEQGWQAINELIRSDLSWSGYERNILYQNNHDGTFSDVSGITGLDFLDDSRSFALADLDHDGRLEVILKNRTAPQLRVLHNDRKELGNSISFRLRGTKSNRDAIGAAITLECGSLRQTKYVQAGSGFLSQHTKEVFFGTGTAQGQLRATIRWPNGASELFDRLPIGHRIAVEEGSGRFEAAAHRTGTTAYSGSSEALPREVLPAASEAWLIRPLAAPEFSLPDLTGAMKELRSLRGAPLLLHFWSTTAPACREQMEMFKRSEALRESTGLKIVSVNVDGPARSREVKEFATELGISFPVLLATEELAGIYNIICRHLFDRRRDLILPTSLLLDGSGRIVKIYQGPADPARIIRDSRDIPSTAESRSQRALPFRGTFFQDTIERNDFTFGVALFQHGYLEQAAVSFEQVIAAKPDDPDAYYNLGTLYLRRNEFPNAQKYLEQAVKLRPDYPEAFNNLGMIAAQQGRSELAVQQFQRSLELRPEYVVALLNLGNLYRRQGNSEEAERLFNHALEIEPNNPEVSYSLGMLFAREDRLDRATSYLQRAIELRPGYADALNNLGVLLVREKRYSEAQDQFTACIRAAPNFDQGYLNLARLYAIQQEKDKARDILQQLLRLQPQHKIAQQTLEMLQ